MQLSFDIDPSASDSLQSQLIGEISTSITTGRLAPGTRLPGTRALSQQLGVSRNTVLLAFAALEAEGFVETRGGPARSSVPLRPKRLLSNHSLPSRNASRRSRKNNPPWFATSSWKRWIRTCSQPQYGAAL